jgi:hypothetical protein
MAIGLGCCCGYRCRCKGAVEQRRTSRGRFASLGSLKGLTTSTSSTKDIESLAKFRLAKHKVASDEPLDKVRQKNI